MLMTDLDDTLAPYRRKRSPGGTPEPAGDLILPTDAGDRLFVIQKHAARRLHYDLRLAVGGVLKSWAVPKGPSMDPADKRLAIMTEDHPLEYADFEGVIPAGEYGAGAMLIWDRGVYDNRSTNNKHRPISMAAALGTGHVKFRLRGRKLQGGFALTRIQGRGEKSQWLLVKMRDTAADPDRRPTESEPTSVVSGREVEAIAEERGSSAAARKY
jgi:DNA ligase D-like protein (predicted 3'-phosphoesterase)